MVVPPTLALLAGEVIETFGGKNSAQSSSKIHHVEALPRTGRTHQIRVHLSEQGHPILGDLTYGGATQTHSVTIPRLMLHASSLVFPHPITKKEITIVSSIPEDFSKCLAELQNRVS
jgi:23S rRNA pseudouridine1911/1915/1917 synthase